MDEKSGIAILCFIFGALLFFSFLTCASAEEPISDPIPMPPSFPHEIAVSGIEETRATVSWSPVPTATQYTVWVDGQRWAGSSYPGAEIKGLEPYTEYSVCVSAANDAGESGFSSSVSIKTLPPVPGTPEMPVISDVTDTTAVVKWHSLPAWQYIQRYRIYVDGQPMADVDVDQESGVQAAELANLEPGKHSVAVSALNENREGELSPLVTFTVQAVPAPAGLVMMNRSTDTIWLTWDAVSNVEMYRITVNGMPAGSTKENMFLLQGLDAESEYQIGVSAVLPDGNESAPATLSIKTLPVTEPMTVSNLTSVGEKYMLDFMPGVITVFIIGAAFVLARITQFALTRRWRILIR